MKEGEGFLARIMPATRMLQALTNRGNIEQECIDEAEEVIVEAKELYADHFEEVFNRHIRELNEAIAFCSLYTGKLDAETESQHLINLISSSVANFRADSSMIGIEKYLDICSVFLRWSESIQKVDRDIKDILEAYLAIIKKMGAIDDLSEKYQKEFTAEIDAACQRYFEKHKEISLTKNIDNSRTLYVSERNQDCGIKEEE